MPPLFTSSSDEALGQLIAKASKRLVLVSPGISSDIAAALVKRLDLDGGPPVFSVIVDIDPEVCRLGYGEIDAIDKLRTALDRKGKSLQTQEGVRIGLVVADEEILVYSPTPRLIEAGSTHDNKPNAIRITPTAAQDIAFACGAGPEATVLEKQELGLDLVDERKLEEVKQDLKAIPPRPFDLARLERVFNYRLEFVEFSLEHYKLNTRTVTLPPELLGLADKGLQDRLRNTFRIFESGKPFEFMIPDVCPFPLPGATNGDPTLNMSQLEIPVSEAWLAREADRLRKKYFIPLGSTTHGNLIQKRMKPEFQGEVDRLSRLVEAYAVAVLAAIQKKLLNTKEELIETLMPRVQAAPPKNWLRRSLDGTLDENTIRIRLRQDIDDAFGTANDTYSPKVTVVFKGVNYDTIKSDPHFRKKIAEYFGEEDAAKLLSEFEASRAKEKSP